MKKLDNDNQNKASITLVLGSYHLPVYAKYLSQVAKDGEMIRNQERHRIQRAHFRLLLYPCTYAGETAENILERYLRRIEGRIKEILGQHQILYWFHVYRRLAPHNTFRNRQIITVGLYRKTLEIAFLKYGRKSWGNDMTFGKDAKPEEIMSGIPYKENNDFQPGAQELYVTKFGLEDFVQLLNVEALAHEFYLSTALLRRVYKGGELYVESPTAFYVMHDNETEFLIKNYDKRLSKVHFATMVGIPFDFPSFDPEGLPVVFFPQYNIALIEYDRLIINQIELGKLGDLPKYIPNFNLVPFDIRTFYESHKPVAPEIGRILGFSYEALMQFLTSLLVRLYLLMKDKPQVEYQMMQRGYTVISDISSFVEDVYEGTRSTRKILNSKVEVSLEEIRDVASYFTYTKTSCENLSLWARGPEELFIPLKSNHYCVNYEAFNNILYSMFHGLGITEDFKGMALEEFLRKKLSRISGIRKWKFHKKLVYSDTEKKEIDYSFVVRDILFVCECRAVGRSVDFERGKRKALEFRKQKLQKALKESDDRVAWLSSHKNGRNYKIPGSVNVICPVVISPFVEYLWSKDSELWLADDVPRILTPEEMEEFIKSGHIEKVYQQPYIKYVS